MQTRHDKNEWLTVGEAASLVGVSNDTLKRWEKAGKVAEAKRTPTGHRRFRRGDVEQLLTSTGASFNDMGGAA